MASQTPTIGLIALSDSDLVLDDLAQDVRGRTLRDESGRELGSIDDLLVDEHERKVRLMLVSVGGFLGVGEKTVIVPIDAISAIDDESVHVSESGEGVADAPTYDPKLLSNAEYQRDVYDWYGYAGYWSPGYVYPTYGPRRLS